MEGLAIRDFVLADQEAVKSLILAGLGEHWGTVDDTLNRDLDDIARSYGNGRTIIAVAATRIVATGTVVPVDAGTAQIVRMSVASVGRRRGVGRFVLADLIDTARVWGCRRVVLETSLHWLDVRAFYVDNGFSISHEVDGEFGHDTWFELQL